MISKYFDLFPKIQYQTDNSNYKTANREEVTNIFFRLGVIRNVIDNIASYFVYDIEDGDTPEIVAAKTYGDAGGAWLILLTNNIMDPQFEWPLDDNAFNQYIIEKYGSLEAALTTVHHYEKVITRTNTRTGAVSETRFVVNGDRVSETMPEEIPFSYYNPWVTTTYRTADSGFYTIDNTAEEVQADVDNGEEFGATLDRGNLAITGEYIQPTEYTIAGEPILVKINGEKIYCYNHERKLNEDKRSIKVIKAEYYQSIQDELRDATSTKPYYIRRLK